MAAANTLAYYNRTTLFNVEAPAQEKPAQQNIISTCHKMKKFLFHEKAKIQPSISFSCLGKLKDEQST
jgi:hypothetical protein